MLGETPVAAGEVEQRVARLESRAEREDQLGAVCEVAAGSAYASPSSAACGRTCPAHRKREQALGVLAQEAQHRVHVPQRCAA